MPTEAQWLEEDIEAVLEWQYEQSQLCPGCGHPRDETLSLESEGLYRARVLRCHACKERDRTQHQFLKDGGNADGLLMGVERLEHP